METTKYPLWNNHSVECLAALKSNGDYVMIQEKTSRIYCQVKKAERQAERIHKKLIIMVIYGLGRREHSEN